MGRIKILLGISMLASIALFAGCFSTTAAGNVGADRNQLMLVSAEEMEQSANVSYAEVLAEAKAAGTLNADPTTTRWVNDIADRLIAQVGTFREDAIDWDWQVNVISDPTVNAWCMPGGKIVVYTGIIESLSLNDAQLAAIMGHEIAHALKEHSREQVSQEYMKQVALGTVSQAIGLGETSQAALALLSQLAVSLPFSRSHETESDHIGTELMARAGYDPYEAVTVWEKMNSLSGAAVPELLSTHPSNSSRINDLQGIAAKVYPLYEAAR